MGPDGLPTSKLTGDSLTACEKIGSTATTIEEAKEDSKARKTVEVATLYSREMAETSFQYNIANMSTDD